MFAAIGISVVVVTLIVLRLWRGRHRRLSAVAGLVGLGLVAALVFGAWGSGAWPILAAVVLAVAVSPLIGRLWFGSPGRPRSP
jgi:hypothetical protein